MSDDVWRLPTSLQVGGEEWPIWSDWRQALHVLVCMEDPELDPDERGMLSLALYKERERLPMELYGEAIGAALAFLGGPLESGGPRRRPLVDWQQDAPLIVPAVNKVFGQEIRAMEYLHWWTFLGAYMEIEEGLFSTVLTVRQKLARGEKLEKYEQRFRRENPGLVDVKRRYRASEDELVKQWTT